MQAGELRGGQDEPIVQVTKHPDPISVQDGGDRRHDPREDLRGGCQPEAQDPELVRPLVDHEAKETTGLWVYRNLEVRVPKI